MDCESDAGFYDDEGRFWKLPDLSSDEVLKLWAEEGLSPALALESQLFGDSEELAETFAALLMRLISDQLNERGVSVSQFASAMSGPRIVEAKKAFILRWIPESL